MDAKTPTVLELFSGTRSFSEVFDGVCKTITVELSDRFEADYTMDIMDIDAQFIKDHFKGVDIIWASPPCDTYSTGTFGRGNWEKVGPMELLVPRSEKAKTAHRLLQRTLYIIFKIDPTFWFIENPRGLMRKHQYLRHVPRRTVTYCQYGDTRMKPTDLFGNRINDFILKPVCKNGDKCHVEARRGARTGTQGMKPADRARVPAELCISLRDQIVEMTGWWDDG